MTRDSTRTAGLGFALASAASFGLSGSLARGLMDAGWSSAAAVSARILLAAAVLAPPAIAHLRGRWHLLRRNAPLVGVYGLLAVAGCQLAFFNAVERMPVGVALLIEYMSPVAVIGWLWLTRAPYILFGTLLGASLWYVSRRLYGNAGGYIALTLYCFSPAVIRSCTLWVAEPDVAGAWGTFGAVFTAIAVSHTLYAPREVVLWNWRRIMLLGVSLTLAVGSQFGLAVVIPVLLGFMLYLAPDRKRAAIAILAAACVVATLLLLASYFFHPALFLQGLKHARFLDANWRSIAMPGAYKQVVKEVAGSGPVLILLVPAALVVFIAWSRTRYFGNVAPLITALLFLFQRVLSPHATGSVFSLTAVVFLFVCISGIVADLLETKSLESVSAIVVGLVAANALWGLTALARIGH